MSDKPGYDSSHMLTTEPVKMPEETTASPNSVFKDVHMLYISIHCGDLIFEASFLERQGKALLKQAEALRLRAEQMKPLLEKYSSD